MPRNILFGVFIVVLMAVLAFQYGLLSSNEMGHGWTRIGTDVRLNEYLEKIRENPRPSASEKLFKNVSYQAGVTHNRWSFDHTIGIAWGDYDNDGWVDLYVTDSGYPNSLYHNNQDGTFSVSSLNETVALTDQESGGAIFADFNNDGWKDLFVAGWGENTLFQNDRGMGFIDITAQSGLLGRGENSKSASWGDFDQDGYLDLYIANWSCYPRCGRPMVGESDRLYHNNGDGTFSDVTALLGSKVEGAGFIASFTDFDNDGDLDIYLINDEFINPIGNALWRNEGPGCDGWCFTEISTPSNADTHLMGMGITTTDYDNDGDLDYYFSNAGPMAFLQNLGDGTFQEVAAEIGLDAPLRIGFGMIALDYDNDAWQDLYLAVPAYVGRDDVPANPLFHNNGDGTFTRVCCHSGAADVGSTLGVAYADYNQDGWVDFLIGSFNQGYELYQNQALAGDENHWITFELRGGGPVNLDAVGTKIILTASGITQTQELQAGSSVSAGNELILHFGLGHAQRASEIKIIWPDGLTQNFENIPADRRVLLHYPVDDGALRRQIDNLYLVDSPQNEIVYLCVTVLIVILMLMISKKT